MREKYAKSDDGQLDRERRGPKPRKQAENQADSTYRLIRIHQVGYRQSGLDTAFGHGIGSKTGNGCGRRQFSPSVRESRCTHSNPDDRIRQVAKDGIKRRQRWNEGPRFTLWRRRGNRVAL